MATADAADQGHAAAGTSGADGPRPAVDRAIEVADQAGAALWQVLLRAEYLTATGAHDELLFRQARSLAEGNDLRFFLDR